MKDEAPPLLRRLRRLLLRQVRYLRLGQIERAEYLMEEIEKTVGRLAHLQIPLSENPLIEEMNALNDEIVLRFEVEKERIARRLFFIEVEQKMGQFLRNH
jgi:hypothetical protein